MFWLYKCLLYHQLIDMSNHILKSPKDHSNVLVANNIDLALAVINKSKLSQKQKTNYCRDTIPERNLLSFSARSLCLCYVPLHINHYSTSHLGVSVLAFRLLSPTFLSPPGTMLTLRVILCDWYQLAWGKAVLLSITTHPRTPLVCSLYLYNITLITIYFYSNEATVIITSLLE